MGISEKLHAFSKDKLTGMTNDPFEEAQANPAWIFILSIYLCSSSLIHEPEKS